MSTTTSFARVGTAPRRERRITFELFDRVAEHVLRDSLHVRAGENVTIESWNTGLDFAQRVALSARRLGANPVVLYEDEGTFVQSVAATPRKYLGTWGPHEQALLAETDAYVFVPSPLLGGSPALSTGDRANSTAYNSAWYALARKARLRGVRMLFGYVGPDLASALDQPVDRVVQQQLRASLTDFRDLGRTGRALARTLRPHTRVVVSAGGESLHFELGSEEVLDDGLVDRADLRAGSNMTNMPPGYYAREIARESVDGTVTLSAPVARIASVARVRLTYRRGELRSWSCKAHARWLDGLIADSPKDRLVPSAVGIGLNPVLPRGYGQDRLVRGSVSFFGFFPGTVDGGTLVAGGQIVTRQGELMHPSRRMS